jgi:hypothetical protein
MQRQATHDTLADQGDALYRKIVRYSADGIVDRYEQDDLKRDARRLAICTQLQATRLRVVRRMVSGGDLDREIMSEVRDYQALQGQMKATSYDEYEAA